MGSSERLTRDLIIEERPGPACHSIRRLASLRASLRVKDIALEELSARFVHILKWRKPPSEQESRRAALLLEYSVGGVAPGYWDSERSSLVLPRPGTITPWSSKATEIFWNCGVESLERVERGVRWLIKPDITEAVLHLHDRMTEESVPRNAERSATDLLFERRSPRSLRVLSSDSGLLEAIQIANREMALALNADEIAFLCKRFGEMGRMPTDAEIMMFAQANSEHCRHKIFNASWQVDGEDCSDSLFEMIRNTYRATNGYGIRSAYKDNAAVVSGGKFTRLIAHPQSHVYGLEKRKCHVLIKVETHNHPTAIAPYPGAATGSGGEIRDEGAVGRGSKPKAGLIGFTTSHIRIPGDPQPWEPPASSPARIASPFEIMLQGPLGAAAFNNEFGRPALAGYWRTFEHVVTDSRRWGFHKPVMLAGGVGSVFEEHIEALQLRESACLVVLGGPALLIGLGGGAASSVGAGVSAEQFDFASVQRENAEMQRRCQEVLDTCNAMGEESPILLVHDVGAGGLSNALPELLKDLGCGGVIDLGAIPTADTGMSPMELWCNEAQERYVLALDTRSQPLFQEMCRRERCPFAIVGHTTSEPHLQVELNSCETHPVDLDLEILFGQPPQMRRSYTRDKRDSHPLMIEDLNIKRAIERVLRFPSAGSKKFLVTIGDRSITGLVARDQMVGPWQVPTADASVTLADFETFGGEAMAVGERPVLAATNPAAAARMAVAEALTNLFTVRVSGLDRVVLSANWMAASGVDGEDQALRESVEAVGMELCPALGIAIPVGKDSLSMCTSWQQGDRNHDVVSPVTLNVSAFATVADVRVHRTPLFEWENSPLYLLALSRQQRLGGSVLAQTCGQLGSETPDVDDPQALKSLLSVLLELHDAGLIGGMHDRSDGGLFTAVAEMSFTSRQGATIDVPEDWTAFLFNEEVGVVVEVAPDREHEFLSLAAQHQRVHLDRIGIAGARRGPCVTVRQSQKIIYQESVASIERLWAKTSFLMQRERDDSECADQEFAGIERSSQELSPQLTFDPQDDLSGPMVATAGRPRVAILREQGVNGQLEMAGAFHRAGFEPVDVHMSDLLAGHATLDEFQVLAACGGFSYGDVLGGGGGWAKTILCNSRLRDVFEQYFGRDTLTIGVCNGCQMLAQLAELVPGTSAWPRFIRNRSDRFEARAVQVKIEPTNSPWLQGMAGSLIPVPIAHGEGRATEAAEKKRNLPISVVAMRYAYADGSAASLYPENPNGSRDAIASVTSDDGQVLAMMPHPERVFRAVQNSWIHQELRGQESGPWLRVFRNAMRALA